MTAQTGQLPTDNGPRSPWPTIGRALFLIVAASAALALIIRDRVAIGEALSKADVTLVFLALLASVMNIILTAVSWRLLLRSSPAYLPWDSSARIFFLGQMGKYVPGTIWSFLASADLAKQAGIARRTAVSSLLLALLVGLGSGAVLAALIVPEAMELSPVDWTVGALALLVAGVLLWPATKGRILKLARIDFTVSGSSVLLSTVAASLGWLFAGAQIALLCAALGQDVGLQFAIEATGIYALAWIAGFVFFIAPAGLGAREGVLVGLLAMQMPMGDAVVIALLARVLITLADFLLGGAALLIRPAKAAPPTAQPLHRD